MEIELVYADSLGAKSFSIFVKTKEISILIDPGAAVMQPSFPASEFKKLYWLTKAKKSIIKKAKKADAIVITHYHWDHFMSERLGMYKGKVLFVKNPNEYINDSQRARALDFFSRLWKYLAKKEISFEKQQKKKFPDTASQLRSVERHFDSYQKRRKELLALGKKWFRNRVKKWKNYKVIPEANLKNTKIIYPEGKTFTFGKTKITFTEPRFHGIEYSRVGWVFSLVIERNGYRFLYTSDLNGPIIEDYVNWVIKEKPNFLAVDGPMTYMLGYTLNRINLNRVIENAKKIVKKVDFEVFIWDHHLTREPLFRQHTLPVWELARKKKKKLLTVSEYKFSRAPVVELLARKKK